MTRWVKEVLLELARAALMELAARLADHANRALQITRKGRRRR
jgi:hypothetical protein